jgi:hypothetical protein
MEENVATSSRIPRTTIMTTAGGGVVPPPPPSPIKTMAVLMPTTSGSGLIPLKTSTTVPFIQNVSGATFSYGIPGFDSNLVITYSTLKTMGMGKGSSNAPLQGSIVGTTASFNSIPYGGDHIPPLSPFLGGAFQQPIGPNANYSLFSGGRKGHSSYTTLVGSM